MSPETLSDEPCDYSITDVLGGRGLNYRIYVVRDGDTVVYVGLAERQSVATRIAIHIQASTIQPGPGRRISAFARLLSANHPRYFGWRVTVHSREQCQILTGCVAHTLACAEQAMYDHFASRQGGRICGNAVRPSGEARRQVE